MESITPGQTVHVKVVKQPTNAAARKTLERLLSKDAGVHREQERLRRARERRLTHHQRGGRQWAVRLVKQHPVQGRRGEEGTIKATVDVLRDLGSVQRFVEVTPA
ncbi:MAG: hypothetical protein ACODAQ_04420 [Phycisphaeraceae bacterium]